MKGLFGYFLVEYSVSFLLAVLTNCHNFHIFQFSIYKEMCVTLILKQSDNVNNPLSNLKNYLFYH